MVRTFFPLSINFLIPGLSPVCLKALAYFPALALRPYKKGYLFDICASPSMYNMRISVVLHLLITECKSLHLCCVFWFINCACDMNLPKSNLLKSHLLWGQKYWKLMNWITFFINHPENYTDTRAGCFFIYTVPFHLYAKSISFGWKWLFMQVFLSVANMVCPEIPCWEITGLFNLAHGGHESQSRLFPPCRATADKTNKLESWTKEKQL